MSANIPNLGPRLGRCAGPKVARGGPFEAVPGAPSPQINPRHRKETMSSLTTDRDWLHRAACQGLDTNLFFPEKGMVPKEIKEVCERCPVQTDCLEYALSIPQSQDLTGVFAGTSARQRRKMRLDQQGPAATSSTILIWDAEAGKYRSVRA